LGALKIRAVMECDSLLRMGLRLGISVSGSALVSCDTATNWWKRRGWYIQLSRIWSVIPSFGGFVIVYIRSTASWQSGHEAVYLISQFGITKGSW